MMKFQEFQTSLTSGKRNHKVTGSWGVHDAFKVIRKNGWQGIGQPLKKHDFYLIIRMINSLLADNMADGLTVKFPSSMGKLELRKFHKGVTMVDGKLKNTYPIDWHNTLMLWMEDTDAHKRKILLRHENEWVYQVWYNKWNANYNNKMFYMFKVNTFIKRKLAKNIKAGKVECLW